MCKFRDRCVHIRTEGHRANRITSRAVWDEMQADCQGLSGLPASPSMRTFCAGETRRPFAWNSSAYAYARSARLQSKQARSTQNPMSLLGFKPCLFANSNTLQYKKSAFLCSKRALPTPLMPVLYLLSLKSIKLPSVENLPGI